MGTAQKEEEKGTNMENCLGDGFGKFLLESSEVLALPLSVEIGKLVSNEFGKRLGDGSRK